MPNVKPDIESYARIKVVGVGGSGGSAITRMMDSRIHGVDFVVINTDAQHLHHHKANSKIHIGSNLTKGLGAGMNPEIGKQAAEENRDEIQDALKGSDMVFITCGLGGGTGTGAAPVVAEAARAVGSLVIGVVTKPFHFEGSQRSRIADVGWDKLRDNVDALITIPNNNLLNLIERNTPLVAAFRTCDEVLKNAVQGISDLITMPGLINIDFADVRTVMENTGSALMGVGVASGENRAQQAAQLAISSPLLDISINGAKGILFNVSGGADMSMWEINEAAKFITESVDKDAKIIFGAVHDDRLKKGEIKITVIATGFGSGVPSMKREDKRMGNGNGNGNNGGGNGMHRPQGTSVHTASSAMGTPKPQAEEESEWDAVPAFLRRKKN